MYRGEDTARCEVCFRHCAIKEGQTGFCGARVCRDGGIQAGNYGKITALALDPVEKKPLRRFYPGKKILSVGSYGCNLRCPFCQNAEISWSEQARKLEKTAQEITPEQLAGLSALYRKKGNIGLAFTYNEPLIGWEFVRDAARLVKEAGMVNVLVTNGTAELPVLEELLPFTDAMNIDLKGFTERYYREVLSGDLNTVKRFIERAVRSCHVELTVLIVPGENDSFEEMERMSGWIAGLSEDIPLHISRFFPCFRMTDRNATEVSLIYRLAETAGKNLKYVYTGNC